MAERIDVLAVMDRQLEFTAASDYPGASEDHRDFLAARDAVAYLIKSSVRAYDMLQALNSAYGAESVEVVASELLDAIFRVSGGAK